MLLLDTGIGARERVARAYLDQLFSAEEHVTVLARLASKGGSEHSSAKQERDRIRSEIATHFPDSEIEGGYRTWKVGGQSFLGPTDSLEAFGSKYGLGRSWKGTYDLLAMNAHPGTAILEFFEVGPDGRIGVTTNHDTMDKLLRVAVVPFYEALKHWLTYCGWPLDDLAGWEEHLLSVFPDLFTVP